MKPIRTVDKYGTIRYKNEKGKCHRLDGPATIYPSGHEFWYINGQPRKDIFRLDPNGTFWAERQGFLYIKT